MELIFTVLNRRFLFFGYWRVCNIIFHAPFALTHNSALMKSCCFFFLFALCSLTATAQTVIFDFEGDAPTFNDFNGSVTRVIDNPDNTAVNSSDRVAQNGVPGGSEFGGVNIPVDVDMTTDKGFTMQVWSPVTNLPVLLKLEGDVNAERSATFTGEANSWQELTFNFGDEPDRSFTSVTVFLNFNVVTTDSTTYYWDNLTQITLPPPALTQMSLPVTFEDETVDYGLADFGGNMSMIVADPEDANNTVASSTKTAGAMTWGGTTLTSTAENGLIGFSELIPFTEENNRMTVRVWSPAAGIPVNLKAEHRTIPEISVETIATTTVAGAWETLTFDFTNENEGTAAIDYGAEYGKVSIFFNFGTSPTADETYYWDDIAFVSNEPALEQMTLPVTFDNPNVDYGLGDFGGNMSMFTTDPDDANNTVASSTKTAGAMVWGGTTITSNAEDGADAFAEPIPFTADDNLVTVRVWSPAAGVPVLLKAEQTDNADVFVETLTNTTVANAWDTLTFNFADNNNGGPAIDYDQVYGKLSIFFNFGTSPTADETYLWDDVYFGSEITRTNEVPILGLLDVSPNPVTDRVNIIAPAIMRQVNLFDANGRLVGQWSPRAERMELDMNHLAPGLYIALVNTAKGAMTVKLVKE